MSSDRVRVDLDRGVADVRLARADRHNGLDRPMFEALVGTAGELAGEPSLRAVVLSGEGPSFCAGLDFKSFMTEGAQSPLDWGFAVPSGDVADFVQRATYEWHRLPVPVIGAVHGHCLGGGCQLALAADIRIAAPDLRLSVMEIRYGLIPDMGLSQYLPRLVGSDVAKELTFTGRIVEASEAADLGLVTRLSERPREEASELACEIAASSPEAVRAAKRLLNESWNAEPGAGLALEAGLQKQLLGSENQLEAVRAAMSGEAPRFADPR